MTDHERKQLEAMAKVEYAKIAVMRKVWTWPEGFIAGAEAAFKLTEEREKNLVEALVSSNKTLSVCDQTSIVEVQIYHNKQILAEYLAAKGES